MIHLKKTLLTLTALFALSTGAGATELTVFDGTTHSFLPFEKSFLYCYQKNEMLFPAADLTAMTGQNITAIQFHTVQESYDFRGASFKVFLKEISTYEFRTEENKRLFYGPDDATTVYEGTFSVEGSKLTITFTTPYAYNGGNLLVGIYVPTPVDIADMNTSQLNFNGKSTGLTVSSLRNDLTQGLDAITSGNDYQYLPKTTFTYSNVEMNDDMTEASFDMPANDVTVDYELVRDMEIAVNAVMPANIRIQQKQGGGYGLVNPSEITPEVKDAIDGESQAVTMTEVTEQTAETGDYTLKLQKLGDGETWVDADPNDLSVGTYRYEVTGANLYDGVCYTNDFKLFEGYPVTVPAGEYMTYYSDSDNLTVDENSGAKLYTITAVSGNIAIATEIPIANAGMPFLIFNSTDEPQTFMLIPTDAEINQTFAREFVGTTTATTIAASTTEQSNYAFNGKQFVIVRTALSVAANKAWLEVKNTNARAINIVLDETTGVNEVNEVNEVSDDTLYDLNGRKVQKPARKGVYVKNGQKVIR